MDITIFPRKLEGTIEAIPSKSQAHRLLICAAFSDRETSLICPQTNRDIEATANCLRALGADIIRTEQGYLIHPVDQLPKTAVLPCAESGSTLRFLLPIAGALGIDTVFWMEGRLPHRPLSPLWEEMERMGCVLTRPSENTLRCQGKLSSGTYEISGNVSSQYITGLLLAAPLMEQGCKIRIIGKLESAPYVTMTRRAMELFGIHLSDLSVSEGQRYRSPGTVKVEGDWSNAAFFLTANTLGNNVAVTNLDPSSAQGDRAICKLLQALDRPTVISASDIPDLVPILAIAAAANHGGKFTDIQRLRLKESDRVETVIAMLKALGIRASATDSILTVNAGQFSGGIVDSANDHRIAMAAAIAATIAGGPVTVLNAQCVNKSYPHFWEEYRNLGGQYELNLR
ncbi:MAG: 3-phosphoshikimate 1-carboxyvinyltransferase [Oscillospiraceae bacterium]|nr:3-phosphoshikimate 1-carboxyvinyltransferase [Oscillospiraceae bacterium]